MLIAIPCNVEAGGGIIDDTITGGGTIDDYPIETIYNNRYYGLYYGPTSVMFSWGEGPIMDLKCEEEPNGEVLISYKDSEGQRYAYSEDFGISFIDSPDLQDLTYGPTSTPIVGGSTHDLTDAKTMGDHGPTGQRDLGALTFTYHVWYMSGGTGYDGTYVATMQINDNDGMNKEAPYGHMIYNWKDGIEVKPAAFQTSDDGGAHYTHMPIWDSPFQRFNGDTGYYEQDNLGVWGHYTEHGRNTKGTWNYYTQHSPKDYRREIFSFYNIGSDFHNSQTTCTVEMKAPIFLQLQFYIDLQGQTGKITHYTWCPQIHFQNPEVDDGDVGENIEDVVENVENPGGENIEDILGSIGETGIIAEVERILEEIINRINDEIKSKVIDG